MSALRLLLKRRSDKPDWRAFINKIKPILHLMILLAWALGTSPVLAVSYLQVVSAYPTGHGATTTSRIVVVFDQGIDLATFAGSIEGVSIDSAHVSANAEATEITIDPGTLTFGNTYNVIIAQNTATPGPLPLTLESDYSFSFIVDGTLPPPLPSSFHGGIHFLDAAPGTSDIVEIFAPGVSGSAATAAIRTSGSDLVYQVNVPGDIPITPTKEGGVENDLLTFMINGRIAATARWHEGTSVLLDLHPPQAVPGGPFYGLTGASINFTGSANDWESTVGSTYEWDWNNDATYDESGATPTHSWSSVGDYTVGFKVTDSQGGEGTTTASVHIASITLDGLNQTYTGSPLAATAATDPSGLTVNFIYNDGVNPPTSTPPTAAGTYTVVATISGYTGSVSDTLVIAPATATLTLGNLNPVYNGSPQAVTVTTTPPGVGVTVTYDDADPLTPPTPSTNPPTVAGTYTVVATITDPNFTGTPVTATMHILSSCSIQLVTGWNLVSSCIQPINTAVPDILSSIEGHYDLVYAWDASGGHAGAGHWMRYAPGIPGNSLFSLDETQGFWIRMKDIDIPTLEFTGTAPTTTSISLLTTANGWNLVGYPSVVNHSMPGALTEHDVIDYSLVYAYHASDTGDQWKRYAPGVPGNDLLDLTPGWGYWIKVTADSTWTVNYLADPIVP